MAAPITHLVLTEKVFNRFFSDKKKPEFFVGTLFADIRYLGVIERKKTHFANLKIADLAGDDSFLAGLKFHSILDVAREKFVIDSGFYSLYEKNEITVKALKSLEDEILYRYIDDYSPYIAYLEKVWSEEKKFGVSEDNIRHWHSILSRYLERKPDRFTIAELSGELGLTEELTEEMDVLTNDLREDPKIIRMIEDLYENFETLLK